jgi:hypothetical protein
MVINFLITVFITRILNDYFGVILCSKLRTVTTFTFTAGSFFRVVIVP